ncbi:MAG: phage terminase large subunit [Candidatus Hamiltonella defensa (Ceratovacuna japonica)]
MHVPNKAQFYEAMLRDDLSSFIQRTFATVDPGAQYLHNWHVDLIAEYLKACTDRDIKRLIINIPPRYLKSIAVSVAWPAWVLGHAPSSTFLASSYSDKLALKHSVDCRLVVQSAWYRKVFPQIQLVRDQNEKSKFVTTARGHRIATSTGGTATGEGGDFLIVYDPHNPRQAESPTEREKALEWFDQTFYSRLNDKKNGVIVVVMQRLHEKDLSGHLLAQGGWEHVKIPAIADSRTMIDFGRIRKTRSPGELLHPEREGKPEIAKTQTALGTYGFSGQYQQEPVPAEGGMIKKPWVHRYKTPPAHPVRIVQSWDTAYKPNQINDPSVCTTWAETRLAYYLLEVWRDRVEYPRLKSAVKSLAEKWHPNAILIEDKASGQSLIQELKASTPLPIIAITPEQDKLTRMSAQSAQFEAGKVFIPDSAAWLLDFEKELFTFPLAEHDDQIDSTSQFLGWVSHQQQSYGYSPVKGDGHRFKRQGAW